MNNVSLKVYRAFPSRNSCGQVKLFPSRYKYALYKIAADYFMIDLEIDITRVNPPTGPNPAALKSLNKTVKVRLRGGV